jgi:hypothetical protein
MIRIHLWSISSDSILGIAILDLLSRQETVKSRADRLSPDSSDPDTDCRTSILDGGICGRIDSETRHSLDRDARYVLSRNLNIVENGELTRSVLYRKRFIRDEGPVMDQSSSRAAPECSYLIANSSGQS